MECVCTGGSILRRTAYDGRCHELHHHHYAEYRPGIGHTADSGRQRCPCDSHHDKRDMRDSQEPAVTFPANISGKGLQAAVRLGTGDEIRPPVQHFHGRELLYGFHAGEYLGAVPGEFFQQPRQEIPPSGSDCPVNSLEQGAFPENIQVTRIFMVRIGIFLPFSEWGEIPVEICEFISASLLQ